MSDGAQRDGAQRDGATAPRYARLRGDWLPRGWSDAPTTLVNWRHGRVRQLGRDSFYAVRACDGRTNLNSPALLPGHRRLLDRYLAEGIAEPCPAGTPLDPGQEYRRFDHPMIWGVHWAVTGRCNLNCRYCFMQAPSGRYGHPSSAEVSQLLDQFERAGVFQVSLTGGEPLLRGDLGDLVAGLTARRIRCSEIVTNGTLPLGTLLETLAAHRQFPLLKISFDGVGAHDVVRGTHGTETRVINSIRLALEAGAEVAVTTTVDHDNVVALERTYDLIRTLHVPCWLIGRPQTTGSWCGSTTALPTPEMARACLRLLDRWLADGRPFHLQLEQFFGGGPSAGGQGRPGRSGGGQGVRYTPDSYECQAVRERPFLLPDGRLLPCVGFTGTALHDTMPVLPERELSDVWRGSPLRTMIDLTKRQVLASNPECAACAVFDRCGAGCRAYALTEAGSLLARDPTACAVWKSGYRKRFEERASGSLAPRAGEGSTRRPDRRKAYKACDPYLTVQRIRALLASLDLFTVEAHQVYADPGVHCCRVMLGDSDLAGLNLGTNGKGLTPRYALASAYGELLERLQNAVLFPLRHLRFATRRYLAATPSMELFRKRLERDDLVLDFHYGPDEVYLDVDGLVETCSDVLAGMLGIPSAERQRAYLGQTFGAQPVACLPYYSVRQRRVRPLPVKLIWNLCGSNGMCAGNTPEEALVQGISEVFERFVIRSIYQREITPPTVDLEHFRGTEIFERIRHLESTTTLRATVKDCSLGQGLPVLGLLLVNDATGRYTFHLGADPSPITALERCLTEIYQGTARNLLAKFHAVPSPAEDGGPSASAEDGQSLEDAARARRAAFYATTLSGSGQWPASILASQSTYPFEGFGHPVSESDADDLAFLTGTLARLGRDLMVRNVSVLGFPAFQVYVPGMSETDFVFDDAELPEWMDIVRRHRTLLDLRGASVSEIADLARAIARTADTALPVSFEPWRWFVSTVDPMLRSLPRDLLLTLLLSRIADYRAAADCLGGFLLTEPARTGPLRYYRAMHAYLVARAEHRPAEQIRTSLEAEFGQVLAARVVRELSEPDGVFDHAAWPACFDCDACPTAPSCRYVAVLRRVKAIQRHQRDHLPNQEALASLFPASAPR